MHKALEDRLRHCQTLPSLSAVALRIIDLAGNPVADFGEVARCVNMDPALAAKILRVANSPFYGKRRRSDNLRQALTLLGLDSTVSLALSFSLMTSLRGRAHGFLDTECYWRRSIYAAIAARVLGDHQNIPYPEELFLAGLLQDIGMLILDTVMGEEYGTVANGTDHPDLTEAEHRSLGTDHLEVGTWVLKYWQLPEYLQQVVTFSHDPTDEAVPDALGPLVRCVAASALIADCWIFAKSDAHTLRAAAACRQWLDMDDDVYHGVMDRIGKELPETAALFDVPALDPAQVTGVLEHAKDILMIRSLHLISEIKRSRTDAEALETRTRALQAQASRDSLTGLFNRGWLDENLQIEFAHATEQNWPLSVAFIDLDHFKRVNDTHGHLAGDQVLRSVAQVLTTSLRQADLITRYGGEEFVVVLPGTGSEAAESVMNRLMRALRDREHALATGGAIRVTASIGLATHSTADAWFESASDLLRAADRAVYNAKREGRDTLSVYVADA